MSNFGLIPNMKTCRYVRQYAMTNSFFNDDFFNSFFDMQTHDSHICVDVKDEEDRYIIEVEFLGFARNISQSISKAMC